MTAPTPLSRLFRVRADGSSPPERVELAGQEAYWRFTVTTRDRLGFLRVLKDVDIFRDRPGEEPTPLLASTAFETGAPAKPKLPAAVTKRKEVLMRLLLKKRNGVVTGLEAQIGRKLSHDSGQKIDSAMDSADQSAQDVDQGLGYSLLEMKYEQYKDIADAFRRMKNESYCLCEECGEEIAIKRLEVNPFARYCIACKTRKEELEKIQREETRFKE